MTALQDLMDDNTAWAYKTFGPILPVLGPFEHLKDEVKEVIEEIEINSGHQEFHRNIRFELADCLLLLLAGSQRSGVDANELIDYAQQKMLINKARKWGPVDSNGVSKHIKN